MTKIKRIKKNEEEPTIKRLSLNFISARVKPKHDGLYFVLYRMLGIKLSYEFGYAQLVGGKWETPDNEKLQVLRYATLPPAYTML